MVKQFRENSKAMRQKWRDFKEEYKSAKKTSFHQSQFDIKKQANLPINYDQLIKEVLTTANSIEKTHMKRPSIKSNKVKPAWARTEEENDQEEERELDDLVHFMDQFDAREYVEDIEVKNILSQLQHQIEGKPSFSKPTGASIKRSESYVGYRPETSDNKLRKDTNPFQFDSSLAGAESKKVANKPESSRPLTTNPKKMKPDVKTSHF